MKSIREKELLAQIAECEKVINRLMHFSATNDSVDEQIRGLEATIQECKAELARIKLEKDNER